MYSTQTIIADYWFKSSFILQNIGGIFGIGVNSSEESFWQNSTLNSHQFQIKLRPNENDLKWLMSYELTDTNSFMQFGEIKQSASRTTTSFHRIS